MIESTIATASIRLTTPLLYASLGELLAQRAGVLNIALEGTMLVGAYAGAMAAFESGSAWVGLAGAVAAGLAFSSVFAWLTVWLAADQILAGTAMNLVAFGMTGLFYRQRFGSSGAALTIPTFTPVRIPVLADLPFLGPLLFEHDVLVYGAFLLVPVTAAFLRMTWPGIALRAAGEKPGALEAAGLSVRGVRAAALLVEGALAGLGGAYLTLAHSGTFIEGITAGRGFIALAIVVSGRWNAGGVLGVGLLFGAATAVQFTMQASDLGLPYQFIRMGPYLLTLAVLAGATRSGRARALAPAALGVPYR